MINRHLYDDTNGISPTHPATRQGHVTTTKLRATRRSVGGLLLRGLVGSLVLGLGACALTDSSAGPAALSDDTFADAVREATRTLTTAHIETTYAGTAFEGSGITASPVVADVDWTSELPAMSVTLTAQGTGYEMIHTDGDVYVTRDTESTYVHVTAAERSAYEVIWYLANGVTVDLAGQAESFADAMTSFESVGTDEVDGAEVAVYRITVDPAVLDLDALAANPMVLFVAKELTVEYGLDADNVPRRIDVTVTTPGAESTMSTVITGLGDRVPIDPPPADQTVPLLEQRAS